MLGHCQNIGITSVHTCLQETEPTVWNLVMKSGRCSRMTLASSLGVLLTIQIPSKHVETLLSQPSSFLRQNMHTHMHIIHIYTSIYMWVQFSKNTQFHSFRMFLGLISLNCRASCTEIVSISEWIILVWSLFFLFMSVSFPNLFFLHSAPFCRCFLFIFADVFSFSFFPHGLNFTSIPCMFQGLF